MKKVDLMNFGVEEMNTENMKETEGGWWQFVAGALVGGLIYDVYKGAVEAVNEYHVNNPGDYYKTL